jgi:hypothetical protein
MKHSKTNSLCNTFHNACGLFQNQFYVFSSNSNQPIKNLTLLNWLLQCLLPIDTGPQLEEHDKPKISGSHGSKYNPPDDGGSTDL